MTDTIEHRCWTREVGSDVVPVPGTYLIDPSHSSVEFVAQRLMVTRVRGRFRDVSGTITIAEVPEDSCVEVVMATASIDTGDDGRDSDLGSADFLDAHSFPLIRYHTTELRPDDGHWRMTGALDLHGQVHPVVLDVDFLGAFEDPGGGHRIGFRASGRLPRGQWGLTYNQVLETGGVLVSRSVDLDLAITAIYQG